MPVVEKTAVFLTGLSGNVEFLKTTVVLLLLEGEVDPVTNTKTAWGKIAMAPRRLAVSVLVSLQNLAQSSFDMEVYTMNETVRLLKTKWTKMLCRALKVF
jgi:hypothetical protein